MIEIINEKGMTLDLSAGFALTIERNNPLFNERAELFADITYPGKAPLTANNKLFIGSGHLVEAHNNNYELPVQVTTRSGMSFLGIFSYAIKSKSIDFTLKVNMGTLVDKMEDSKLSADYSFYVPADTHGNLTVSAFISLMQNSVTLPHLYPFVFCPVFNNKKSSDPEFTSNSYLNSFEFFSTNPKIYDGFVNPQYTHEAPFYKLRYVVGIISKFLGFSASGDLFIDPYYEDIYIYTNRTVEYNKGNTNLPGQMVYRSIGSFGKYMPDITISEFFKQLRERLHINMEVDALTSEIVFNSGKGLLETGSVTNISRYIAEISEISVDKASGLRVTLKPDPSDEGYFYFNPVKNENVAMPEYELVVNAGKEDKELDISTLKMMQGAGAKSVLQSINSVTDPLIRVDITQVPPIAKTERINSWPLRLFRYKGINQADSWPRSEPLNLDERDVQWYRFINQVKNLVIITYLPEHVLRNITLGTKLQFTSEQGFEGVGVIKSMEFDISVEYSELIEVEFNIYMLNSSSDTTAVIKAVDPTKSLEG